MNVVTAETITCRHCAAVGIRNFTRRVYDLAEHPSVEAIICLVCGDWHSSRPVTKKMERIVPPLPDRKTLACLVAGCPGKISEKNQSGLCTLCLNRLQRWQAKGKTATPPFIRTPTGYMTRAAFEALNPESL